MKKCFFAYPLVELREEQNAVVRLVSDIAVVWLKCDLVLSLSTNIVGHFDLRHGTALVNCESGESSLFILEVHVCHAVNGQKRCDMLSVFVDADGGLEENAADWAKSLEHLTDLLFCDVVGQAADVEIGLLLVAGLVLAAIHPVELPVARDEDSLLGFAAWERLVVHCFDGVLRLLSVDEVH